VITNRTTTQPEATVTTHRTIPSEVEPDQLADLIADCAEMPDRVIDLTALRAHQFHGRLRVPEQREALVIPEGMASMLEGFGDYGC
jgi:hypothetical protein